MTQKLIDQIQTLNVVGGVSSLASIGNAARLGALAVTSATKPASTAELAAVRVLNSRRFARSAAHIVLSAVPSLREV